MVGPGRSRAEPSGVAARLSAAPGPVLLVTVALGYLALSQLVMWVNSPVANGASLWPAAGLTLAALLVVPTVRWGWVLGAVMLAELAGDLAWGYPVGASVGWALSNTLEPLVGALLLRRFAALGYELPPARRFLLFLAFAVVVGPLVGASVGAAASAVVSGYAIDEVWLQYFVGDALGVLIVAPLLLAGRRDRARRSLRELAALTVASALTTLAVFSDFGGTWMVTMPYLVIPFFAWAALRFGTVGTAWMALAVTVLANASTVAGFGPFAVAADDPGEAVLLLQVFLAITVSTAHLLAAVVSDLRDRRQMESMLRHQATHDVLTGLANRLRLGDELEAACQEPARPGTSPGLLVCDLDGFKAVNDRVGHRGGDALLVQLAQRLTASVRPDDLVARISGDEFVVLLRDVDEAGLTAVARRVSETVADPVQLEGRRVVRPSVSVGAALRQSGESPEDLFRLADAALYEAKRRGRGRVLLADEELRGRAAAELRTEDRLAAAFDEGQIVTYFQPIIDLAGGRVAAAEAIVRWRHPELGMLDEERFLPAVEATGLGDKLFETVLAQALEAQVLWSARSGRQVPVSVNVSATQLAGGGVVTTVLRALSEAAAPAESLYLEVTKHTPLDDVGMASLNQLHALGVRVVLDGLGAGWSSMTQLTRSPWDHLKIDRSFMTDLGREAPAADVFRAMTAMAEALGIRVAADGVTRIGQIELLSSLGCQLAQGPLLGRPETAEDLAGLLAEDRLWVVPATGEGGVVSAAEL
ncbi:MAG TPA: EAL domain-containing protein [Nocardioidaceae bacterium]|nr:EAL domain-containing protein [Nocardioidaceae bacterium]